MTDRYTPLFESFSFKNGSVLRNRIVMAPMTTWSGNPDGTVSEQELTYYRRRSTGAGLVITGCAHVTANGIGFHNEFAACDDDFIPSLKSLADTIKSGGAKAVLQIFHAGNKAVPELIDGQDVVSASSLKAAPGPFNSGEFVSRELVEDEIKEIISSFGKATRRAIEAGFDGVELHGAHGFLLQNFLSPKYNVRSDRWGGSLVNRLAFPLAVAKEVRRIIDEYGNPGFILGYRLSPEESEEDGLRIDDVLTLIDELCEVGIDYLHASLKDVLRSALIDKDAEELAIDYILKHINSRIPVIAAGHIETPEQAQKAFNLGLSLVAVGKGLVINPNWVELVKEERLHDMDFSLARNDVENKSIPINLWRIIESTTGWFPIYQEVEA